MYSVSLWLAMGRLRSNAAFVRLFLGRLVTNAGDSMYLIASMWLVHELTGSPLYTGLAGFLLRAPAALQFLVGPLVDRWSLRSLLVRTQAVQGICVLVVPLAAATGHLSVWVVLVVMPVLMFLNQFVYPAQSAALPRIVDDDQLVRANSLFTFALRGSDMVFNAVSGLLVAIVGAVALFVVDSLTFAVAVVLFFGLSVPDATGGEDDADDQGYLARLADGLRYVHGSALAAILLGAVVVNLVFGVMIAVLPAFADSIGGPEAYGLLLAAEASGTLVGAVAASRVEDAPFGRVVIVGYAIAAVFWVAALVAPGLMATVALFFVAFVPIGASNVMIPSMVQSVVEESLLARVSSVVASASTATLPVGSLIGGAVAAAVGVRTVMYGGAVAFAFLVVYFLVRPELRSLPPVAEADPVALDLQ